MANTQVPPRSELLIQRRARGWLDDNCSDWEPTFDGQFVTRIPLLDETVYSPSIVELCVLCAEKLNDPFRP